MLSTVTEPGTRNLVALARVKRDLKITGTGDDQTLDDLIADASDLIVDALGFELARGAFTETVPGFGTTRLVLSRCPIASVSEVLDPYDEAVTDYVIENAKAGFLYRAGGWASTAAVVQGLVDTEVPGTEEPSYTVTYVGGYLLPDDDLSAETISAATSDNSFNDSAAGMPLIQPDEYMTVTGFVATGLNRRYKVVSRTASKIVVAETLTDVEAAGAAVTLAVRTLDRTFERMAVEAVRNWHQAVTATPGSAGSNVISKKVGPLELRYSESKQLELPTHVMESLSRWASF